VALTDVVMSIHRLALATQITYISSYYTPQGAIKCLPQPASGYTFRSHYDMSIIGLPETLARCTQDAE
jgi:hypothetical protein